jgi:hypothetical protein
VFAKPGAWNQALNKRAIKIIFPAPEWDNSHPRGRLLQQIAQTHDVASESNK